MAFLNPFLLWGSLAISIPIVIHLLNRRKFERVIWAAMKFLRVSVEQNQRRILIEDILLLLLRCLLLAVLALCVARPAIKAAGAAGLFGRARVTGVILLDNSYSMSATDGVQSRFEQAKTAADSILDTLPSGSSVAVVLASDVANRVIPQPTFDLNLVRKTIRDARLSDRTTDVEPSIHAALDILRSRPGLRKEMYLITDGQANGWEKMDDIHNQLEVAKGDVKAQVVLVGSKLDSNVGVSDLKLVTDRVTDLPVVDRSLSFSATVKNYGTDANAEVRNVHVTLRVDGEPTADDTVIDSLKPEESKTVTLSAKMHTVGTHAVTVGIPLETDRLPADDSRTIAVSVVKEIRVLMVDGDPGSRGREASTATLRKFLVLVPPADEEQYFLKVSTISPADLENQRLDEYSVVVLSNVTDLSPGTLDNFASYLRRGLGGLTVFPGSFTNPNFYNEQMVRKYHFLPASLGPVRGSDDPDNDSIYFQLQGSNFTSEVAKMWSAAGSGSPTSVKFWRAFELTPDAAVKPLAADSAAVTADPYAADAGVPQVVLSYGKGVGDSSLDGKPAVMERQWGMGRVFEFSSTADRKWNTGALDQNVMLPLFQKIVGVIVRRQDDALNVKVGDTFIYHPVDDLVGKDALIGRADQMGHAADSRRVEMVNRLPQVSFDGVENSGEYEMDFPGGVAPIKFAAYADERESEIAELTPPQLARIGEVAGVTHWTPGEPLGVKFEKDRIGTELWTAFAILALVLATAETFLAHWFSRTK